MSDFLVSLFKFERVDRLSNPVLKSILFRNILSIEFSGLPTEAYVAESEIREDGKPAEKTWRHISSAIGAEEAEEVGVEQLLRDVYNPTAGSLRLDLFDHFKQNQQLIKLLLARVKLFVKLTILFSVKKSRRSSRRSEAFTASSSSVTII